MEEKYQYVIGEVNSILNVRVSSYHISGVCCMWEVTWQLLGFMGSP